jgi:hypothetical protein
MPTLTLDISGFSWSRLREEAEAEGVAVEELVRHAVAYYLADLDSERVSARPLRRDRTQATPYTSPASAPERSCAGNQTSRTG